MARVLVVDDEPDGRALARLILTSRAHQIDEAVDGRDAVSKIESNEYDIVLLDVRMPRMDGWAVLEQMRDKGTLERTKVIMLSAHASPGVEEQALNVGAVSFLTKPYSWNQILTSMDDALGTLG